MDRDERASAGGSRRKPDRDERPHLVQGVLAIVPLAAGVLPFGMAYGAAVAESEVSGWVGLMASVLILAGASQLALVDLIQRDAHWAIAIGTALVINARFVMYSGALAVPLGRVPARLRFPLIHLMTDQATAASLAHAANHGAASFGHPGANARRRDEAASDATAGSTATDVAATTDPADPTAEAERTDGGAHAGSNSAGEGGPSSTSTELEPSDFAAFFAGAGLTLLVTWTIGTWIGIEFGARVPEGWQLGFAVPLMFLALLIPSLIQRPTLVAAGVSAVVTLLAHSAPFGSGLLIGALSGVAAGVLLGGRLGKPGAVVPDRGVGVVADGEVGVVADGGVGVVGDGEVGVVGEGDVGAVADRDIGVVADPDTGVDADGDVGT